MHTTSILYQQRSRLPDPPSTSRERRLGQRVFAAAALIGGIMGLYHHILRVAWTSLAVMRRDLMSHSGDTHPSSALSDWR